MLRGQREPRDAELCDADVDALGGWVGGCAVWAMRGEYKDQWTGGAHYGDDGLPVSRHGDVQGKAGAAAGVYAASADSGVVRWSDDPGEWQGKRRACGGGYICGVEAGVSRWGCDRSAT